MHLHLKQNWFYCKDCQKEITGCKLGLIGLFPQPSQYTGCYFIQAKFLKNWRYRTSFFYLRSGDWHQNSEKGNFPYLISLHCTELVSVVQSWWTLSNPYPKCEKSMKSLRAFTSCQCISLIIIPHFSPLSSHFIPFFQPWMPQLYLANLCVFLVEQWHLVFCKEQWWWVWCWPHVLGHRASGQWIPVYQGPSGLHHRNRSLQEMPGVMSQGHGPA